MSICPAHCPATRHLAGAPRNELRVGCPLLRTFPSCPRLSSPTRPHTRAVGHAHADLRVPTVQEAGGGEHSESRLLPKSIGILSPPPGPHLRLWRSQQQVRIPTPPLTHTRPPPFYNLSQPLELGTAPLSPNLPPYAALLPPFSGGWEKGACRGGSGSLPTHPRHRNPRAGC